MLDMVDILASGWHSTLDMIGVLASGWHVDVGRVKCVRHVGHG